MAYLRLCLIVSGFSFDTKMFQLDAVGLSNDEQFSKSQIQFIRHHIQDAEAEIDRIDDTLLQLPQRRKQVADKIYRYKIAIAPHKKLTEDVIRYIFACFVQDRAIHFPYKRDEPRQVVLSHVCSAWRRIVLDMKSLWSQITIVPRKSFRAFCETWSPRIFTRITVDLSSYEWELCHKADLWDSFLHLRFEEVEFIMNGYQLHELGQVRDVSLKAERVALVIQVSYEILRLPPFISGRLYSFKTLAENIDNNRFHPENIFFPWAQLRSLDLSSHEIYLSHVMNLLPNCTSLEACALRLCPADNAYAMPSEQVVLPVLRKFTIHMGGTHMGGTTVDFRALSIFLLPSLKILEIQGGKWTYDIWEVLRKQFNLQQLHELDITHVTYSPTILSLLKGAPLLRRLSLSPQAMFDQDTLLGLGSGELGQHLELLDLYDSSCGVNDMRKMVEARQFVSGISPLFHVQFTCTKRGPGEVQSRFLVVSNDMRIELRYVNQ